jgi:glycolate oxidase FAD binding subunit
VKGIDAFNEIVGEAHVERRHDERLDGVCITAVVRPGNAEEVAECLGVATRDGLPLVASGAGTKLGWGNRPAASALVRLDLSRLAGVVDLDADEGVASVEAGVTLGEFATRARACGKHTFLDPGRPDASVGGTIATDPPDPCAGPEPRLRDDLLGLRVALADGRLTRCGGRVVKNVTGFDLVRLYCGSFGTLGVIVEATLRLRPRPESERVLVRAAATFEAACETAREILEARVRPAGLAILPEASAWRVVWRVAGAEADVALRAGRRAGDSATLRDWESVGRALVGDAAGEERVRVRLASRATDSVALGRDLRLHGGEHALRAALPAAGIVLGEIDPSAAGDLLEEAVRHDWVVFVERAAPALKQHIDVFGAPPPSLGLMRVLKQRFDPKRVLSPGRFVGRL